jgi:chromate transporter
MATYFGWVMHGVRGGLAAGILFVLPSAAVMLALSLIYTIYGDVPVIASLFFRLKWAVLVMAVEALLRVSRRALKGRSAWALALAAFVPLFFLNLLFPLVILTAAAIGYFVPGSFAHGGHGKPKATWG